MLPSHPIRGLGFVLAGVVALSIGARPPLRALQATAVIHPSVEAGGFGGKAQDGEPVKSHVYLPSPPMTVAETKTRLKLHEKIPMHFAGDTTLEEVKKYIEQSTIDKTDFPEGISIYVDPQGLQDADKTMASTIIIDLKNLPLETTLTLLLKQLGLTYWVNKDGLLIITSSVSEDLILTPAALNEEILANLSALRSEIRSLRSEVQMLRRNGAPEDQSAGRPGLASPPGGMSGKGGMM
jgi:hypothetical protein